MCSKFRWLVQKLWKITGKYEIIIWISASISIYYTSLAFSISIHSRRLLGGGFPWALGVRRLLAHPLANMKAYFILLPLFSAFSVHCSPQSAQVRKQVSSNHRPDHVSSQPALSFGIKAATPLSPGGQPASISSAQPSKPVPQPLSGNCPSVQPHCNVS